MFSIGDFANLGRVSVRMLRHYDAIGLLRPARVDPATGYRFYTAAQLRRLNRVIALKDLGFTLQQVQTIIDEKVDGGELRGMLRLRRAQLADQMADGQRPPGPGGRPAEDDRDRGPHGHRRRHPEERSRDPGGGAVRTVRELRGSGHLTRR